MKKIIFPLDNGIGLYSEGRLCVSIIDKSGNKRVEGMKVKSPHKFFSLPIVRGFCYFIVGIFLYIKTVLLSLSMEGGEVGHEKNKSAKKAEKMGKTSAYLLLLAGFLLAFLYGFLALGILPSFLCKKAFSDSLSIGLRGLIIALFRFAILYISLFALRLSPFASGLYSFNGAGSTFLAGGGDTTLRSRTYPLNFLNFLANVFIFSTFVVSLVGVNLGFAVNFVVAVAIFIATLPLVYELLHFATFSKHLWLKDVSMLTNWLFSAKANTTHEEVVKVAQIEIEKFDDFQKTAEGRTAMSALIAEMQTRLRGSERLEMSDIDWIIATVLGKNRAEIKLVRSVSAKEQREIMRACDRRAKGEPLSSIFGFVDFYGLRIDVNKKVLSPRMETELLVDEALKKIRDLELENVLDLCTGSGAIAIAVAKYSNCNVSAIDFSKPALLVAENNAKKNQTKVHFICSDLFKDLKKGKKYDIILSNPPYIKTKDIEKLDVEVKKYDPRMALDGGEDGLDFYRQICKDSPKHLTRRGWLMFEVGQGQANSVCDIMSECGFGEIQTVKDYNKIERIVYGRINK